MSVFSLHRLLQVGAVLVALFGLPSIHGFVVAPHSSSNTVVRPRTVRFIKQPTSLEEILPAQTKKNKNEMLADVNVDDEDKVAYQRKMAISFFLADTSLFGFVLLAVVATAGAILNLSGYDYVILPDGTLLIDTLEHFQMQYWIDAIPPIVAPLAI